MQTKTRKKPILPRFTRDPKSVALIRQIAHRAVEVYGQHGITLDMQCTQMDLSATHANGCKLDLAKMLKADDFNLMHDITGIYRNLNRDTGKLENHFLPRAHLQHR